MLTDVHAAGQGAIRFEGEFDRVYVAPKRMCLRDGNHALHITQSPSWANTVVWNPGPLKVLGDMPQGDFAKMLCVEAAQVFEPINVRSGQHWQGWQHLQVQA